MTSRSGLIMLGLKRSSGRSVNGNPAAAGMALQDRGHARRIRIPLQRERSGSDLDTIDLALLVRPGARRYRGNGVSEAWHSVSPTLLA